MKASLVTVLLLRLWMIALEYTDIIRGTWSISSRARIPLVVVFLFNTIMSVLELLLIGITAFMLNSLEHEAGLAWSVVAVSLYYVLRVGKDSPLEFVRDYYAETYFRRQLFVDLSVRGRKVIGDSHNENKQEEIASHILRGRESWMILIEFPIRELSTIILTIPAFFQLSASGGYWIAAIIFLSVPAGILVTMAKDLRLEPAFSRRQRAEYDLLETEVSIARNLKAVTTDEYRGCAECFAEAHRTARVRSSGWDNLARDLVFNVALGVALAISLFRIMHGLIGVGDFVAVIALSDFARRPVQSIFAMQAEMQVRREAILQYRTLLRV